MIKSSVSENLRKSYRRTGSKLQAVIALIAKGAETGD